MAHSWLLCPPHDAQSKEVSGSFPPSKGENLDSIFQPPLPSERIRMSGTHGYENLRDGIILRSIPMKGKAFIITQPTCLFSQPSGANFHRHLVYQSIPVLPNEH